MKVTAFNILEEASEPDDAISILQTGAAVDILLVELADENERGVAQIQALRAAAPTARIVLLADGLSADLLAEVSSSSQCPAVERPVLDGAVPRVRTRDAA